MPDEGCRVLIVGGRDGSREVATTWGEARRLLPAGVIRGVSGPPIDAHESRTLPPNGECLCSCDVRMTAAANGLLLLGAVDDSQSTLLLGPASSLQ